MVPKYNSIDELLLKKYGIKNTDDAYKKIDFRNKTEFVDKYGRPVSGVLTYAEAEQIIELALSEEIL